MPNRRGLAPVVAVVLMVALTLLLAAVLLTGLSGYGDRLGDRSPVTAGPTETSTDDRWHGDPDDLFRLSERRADATEADLRLNFTVVNGSETIGNSLNSVYMEAENGSVDLFAGAQRSDLDWIMVDEDGDGELDREITGDVDDWQVKDGGSTLKIGLSGSMYTPGPGESIVVVLAGMVDPPGPGTYELRAQTSGDGNWQTGNVTITA